MTVLAVAIALLIGSASPAPPARGGHAHAIPPRGGHALGGLVVIAEVIAAAPTGDVPAWTCVHQHEGAWNDAGDPYWGGLQMNRGFMATYGGDVIALHHGGLANVWTPREQIVVAERGRVARHGYNPWPNTGRACGLPMYV